MPSDQELYAEILEFAYTVAEQASKLILDGAAARWKNADFATKKNAVDLVTETDQAVEDFIRKAISDKYPSHKFIGEESSEGKEKPVLTDDFTWIVDPIDGTMNFVHANPNVSCSIGVMHEKRPVVGVISQPFLNRIFSARDGNGAFMNRTVPLPLTGGIPQPLNSLSQCLIAAEWGSDRRMETIQVKLDSFKRLNGDPNKGVDGGVMVHALRTTGATTVNLIHVAAGELDVSWDAGCWAWDVAAAAVILKETGAFFAGGQELYERDAPIDEVVFGRRYVAIRAVAPTAEESSEQIQRRLATHLYSVVEEWTTPSMM
ncbi:uncharacterized protein EHS24_005435 [Apiotrichum porosum]|uniref:Inositol-1-monophosphatase n=1 Tax=Apiotrichum porosum TaxID=105984 RepID=A0A427XD74_9TREE|nr:uncharacterized protein EHS24_005435 [Apiotrichum porosum]RSH76687.1 hypothetical protein EHS24_005435 [Apiotrichum porosum]